MGSSAGRHAAAPLYDHPSTLAKIERLLALLPPGNLRVLDAGCGDGRLAKELVARGHAVTGLDANAVAVAIARSAGIAAEVADLETRWPVADGSQDLVLLLDALEHLVDPAVALAEARRVLAPGGHAIVVFPNHFDLRQRLETLMGRGIVHWSHRRYAHADAASYGHVRFLRLSELEKAMRAAGFAARAWQCNFMGGGIVPRRLLPRRARSFLARRWPDLFSGKFGALLATDGDTMTAPAIVALDATPEGL